MSEPLPQPRSDAADTPNAGWYIDPTAPGQWRWWDGATWTSFVAPIGQSDRTPRLPRWLSVPVVVCAVPVVLLIGFILIVEPLAMVAGLAPLAIVLPTLAWLDRVEPEPRSSRVHALLWGSFVAVLVALVVNTVTALAINDVAAMVISAPLIEEAMKGLGIVWAVRRREVDGVSDGIVYAGWVAIGFAAVEDMTYFADATISGDFLPVFIVRALLTPFAHPLFTFWTGLAIGRAVQRGKPIFPAALWGLVVAVATHAAWNGSLALGDVTSNIDEDVAMAVIVLAALMFVVLFIAVAVVLIQARRAEQRRFIAMVPFLAQHYGLSANEQASFADWSAVLRARKVLPRRHRRHFDAVHASLARLVLHHERLGQAEPAAERVLASQLTAARQQLERDVSA